MIGNFRLRNFQALEFYGVRGPGPYGRVYSTFFCEGAE